MGTYRFLLATLVAMSHAGIFIFGYNPGVFAVVSFFIISGFVTTILIEKNYQTYKKITLFYKDRLLRIYPQFLFYFSASCIVIYLFLPNSIYANAITAKNIIASLAIAPLDLYSFGVTNPAILPPAWSLGLEIFFYSVIPFILILRMQMLLFSLSVVVFLIACLGIIDTDIWGYRLLPGTLFIFLCGSFLYKPNNAKNKILIATTMASGVILTAILCGLIKKAPFNVEVSAGLFFGIPAVWALSKTKQSKIDSLLGNISYGLFLNHFILIYILSATKYSMSYYWVIGIIFASSALSMLTYYLIEKPILKIRHNIRSKIKASQIIVHAS